VSGGQPGPPGSRRRSWGWHRLEPIWARRIVADAAVRPGQHVVDLGAGSGALTRPLVDAGARVLAVELNAGRAERLRSMFADDPVTVLEIDLANFRLPHKPFQVVANPPFGGANALVRELTAPDSALVSADIVLQLGLVIGLVNGSDNRRFGFRMGRRLPRHAFVPQPRVDLAVLRITRR